MPRRTPRKKKPANVPASVCWFDVPVDDLERAKRFYTSLFGWRVAPFPAAVDHYWHLDTGGPDASPDGGLLPRMHPDHSITVYVTVSSVAKAAKVRKLGGAVCRPKTAVPSMGYFAICEDTEHNVFALWEPNPRATTRSRSLA